MFQYSCIVCLSAKKQASKCTGKKNYYLCTINIMPCLARMIS